MESPIRRTTRRHVICKAVDLPIGARRIVEVEGKSIGVFHLEDGYFALRNTCPHQGAPLCRGRILDLIGASDAYAPEVVARNRVLKCPWHGWEFDIHTGHSVFQPQAVRVRSYDVTVEQADPVLQTYDVAIEQGVVVLIL